MSQLLRMMGKLIGALAGAAVGMLLAWSPLVALGAGIVGLFAGHFLLDREPESPRALRPATTEELLSDDGPTGPPRRKRRVPPPAPKALPPTASASADEARLATLLCPIFIEVARADGPVVRDEVRVVREYFELVQGFSAGGAEAVRLALKAALGAPTADLETLVKAARQEVKPADRLPLVRALYEVALVDGELKKLEADALKQAVAHFNLSDEQLREITREFLGGGAKHYQTLGLTEDATDDEIKAAFRKLASEHHPDRAAGLSAQDAAASAERFREIKDAYEELRKLRGL